VLTTVAGVALFLVFLVLDQGLQVLGHGLPARPVFR
jgi:hypothetical protein